MKARWMSIAAGLGVVAGAFYTFSPLTVCCLAGVAALVRWTVRNLEGRERQWVFAALSVALVLRLIAIGILPFLVDPRRQSYISYFGDAQYAIQRSIWIRNIYLWIPVGARDYIEAFEPVFGWSGYNYLLAFLHVIFGRSPYGVAILSTALFLTAAACLYRWCRPAFGPLSSFAGLLAVLFMPSLFAWSVVPLKEAMQFVLLASALAATMAIASRRWSAKAGAAAGLVASIVVSGALRNGGAVLVAMGIGGGAAIWLATRRVGAIVAILLLLPLAIAVGARSQRVDVMFGATVRDAAIRHLGHARSPGAYYRLLDDRFYAGPATDPEHGSGFDLSFDQDLRFLIRAVVNYFAQPLPWEFDSMKWLALVPQQVVWYLSLGLALVGGIRGLWRQPFLTALLLGIATAGVVVVAPNSGNIGTLIRHRDMVVPFILMLAGFGAVTVAERVLQGSAHPLAQKVVG